MTRHLESEQQYQISGDKFGRAYRSIPVSKAEACPVPSYPANCPHSNNPALYLTCSPNLALSLSTFSGLNIFPKNFPMD